MSRLFEYSNATLSCFSPLFAKILCTVSSVDSSSQLHNFFFFKTYFFFLSQTALNRNLSLGFYFWIHASITITSEARMIGRISRKNQDYNSKVYASRNRRVGGWQVTCEKTSLTLIPSSTRQCHETRSPGSPQMLRGRGLHRTGFLSLTPNSSQPDNHPASAALRVARVIQITGNFLVESKAIKQSRCVLTSKIRKSAKHY